MASSGVTAIVSRTAKRSARPGKSAVAAGLIASAMFLAGCQSFPTVSTLGGLTGARDAKIAAARESDSLFGSYLAARHAGLDRDMDAAAAYYEQALKNDPSNLVILERSFLLEVSAGSVDKAMRLADRLVAERPNNRIARLALGLREMRAGRMEAARADFKEASGGLYNQLIVSLLNGWTYAGEGNSKAALGSLDQFSAVAASSAIPVFHKALILDQLGEGAEAEAAFAEVFERDGQDDFRVVETYGSFLERNGRLADARALYAAYLDVDPDNPVITARAEALTGGSAMPAPIASIEDGAAEAIFSIARLLAQERTVDLPTLYLQLALYMQPDFDPAKMILAELQYRIDRFETAAEIYNDVPRDSAYWRGAQIGLAASLEQLERSDNAIDILNRLLRDDASDYDAAVALGDLYRREDAFEKAIDAYTIAIDALSRGNNQQWFLYYARGISYERAKQWESAEDDFMKALELSPDQPLVLNYLAYSWIEQGMNYTKALELLHLAAEQRPNDGYIIDSLGWAYYRLGRYEEAVTYLEQAILLAPSESIIHDHLGDAYWKVGRRIEARFQWRHALDYGPEDDQIELIQRKLDQGLETETNPSAEIDGTLGAG